LFKLLIIEWVEGEKKEGEDTELPTGGGRKLNEKALKLVWLMVISTMAKTKGRTWALYEDYIRETRLHVTVEEILRAKREGIA